MQRAGTTMDDFRDLMNDDVGEMTSSAEELSDSMVDMSDQIINAFDAMTEALSNWQAEYSANIEDMLSKNEALATSFNNLLKSWSGYNDTVGMDDSEGELGEDAPAEEGGPPADQGEPDEPDSKQERTDKYKKGVAAAIWGYPGGAGWGHGNSSKKLTSGTRYNRFKEKGLIPDQVQQQINKYSGWSRAKMLKDAGITNNEMYKKYTYRGWAFDTGGYTGDWAGNEGRLAILHSKELVLKPEDTENVLASVEILRNISRMIDINALASAGYMSGTPNVGNINSGTLEQEVHITAEFPNATNRNEIEEAFGDLINLASQYANRK